jgi:hypothetical protein
VIDSGMNILIRLCSNKLNIVGNNNNKISQEGGIDREECLSKHESRGRQGKKSSSLIVLHF